MRLSLNRSLSPMPIFLQLTDESDSRDAAGRRRLRYLFHLSCHVFQRRALSLSVSRLRFLSPFAASFRHCVISDAQPLKRPCRLARLFSARLSPFAASQRNYRYSAVFDGFPPPFDAEPSMSSFRRLPLRPRACPSSRPVTISPIYLHARLKSS